MAKSHNTTPSKKTKINKNMVLGACEGALEFIGDASCTLSVLMDALEAVRKKAEDKDNLDLEGEIDVFATALKFFYNGFSRPYEDLAEWIGEIKKGDMA